MRLPQPEPRGNSSYIIWLERRIVELETKVEELTTENERLSKQMWAAQYCNPTEDLRLAKLKVEKLTAENKQLNTDLRIALSVQDASGFKLLLKQEVSDGN